jgi:hypothetical protein
MNMIMAKCRAQFTAQDVDFIVEVLGARGEAEGCLTRLLSDEESRDLILDDEAIYRALLEQGGCLRVSTRLYFYTLVRQVMRRAGLEDRHVADYVAELLSVYGSTESLRCRVAGQEQSMDYFVDMLGALEKADDYTAFHVRAHIGNQSLFMTGVFPEHLRHRTERRGAPGMKYYEALGRASYRVASDHRLAERYEVSEVLSTLSEQFETARQALNDLSERVLALGEADEAAGQWLGRN